jgi:RNA polymerase sigma-70 factor, ECF subfamily
LREKTTALKMLIEKDLLARLKNADETAFTQIFDIYVKKVYHFVFSYVKEKTEAEDITQNVFIKIWEKKSSIDTSKSFEGFIFTVAYRLVIDYFRQHAAPSHRNTKIGLSEESIASAVHSDDLLKQHQLESLYEKALLSLPAKRKEIFLLSRHNGLSNKQIAEQLGLSIKTVENQMTAALCALKAFFGGLGPDNLIIIFLFFLTG